MLRQQRLELRHAGTTVRAGLEARADVGGGHATGLDGFENRGLARAKQASWRTWAMLVRSEFVLLFIYLIMTADIEKNNLLFRHLKRQVDTVTVGNAHRV